MTDVNDMKVPQLQKELKRYGLSTKGKKAELCKRLSNFMKEIEDPLTDKSPTCNNYIKVSDFNNYVNEYSTKNSSDI